MIPCGELVTLRRVVHRTRSLGPDLARRLRLAREVRGLTVRELAQKAHLSTSTLVKLADGRGSNAGLGMMMDLARALKVSPCWLCFGQGDGPEEEGE